MERLLYAQETWCYEQQMRQKSLYDCDKFSSAEPSVMRRLLAVFLLLSVFCQAFATARQTVVLDHGSVFLIDHAAMHLEGASHHHDEDGVAHQDDSQESIQHMLADAGPGTAALFLLLQPSLPFGRLPAPAVAIESVGPPPYLDGLRRPPRLFS